MEIRVPRAMMVFFVIVKGKPVTLMRHEPIELWWNSIALISQDNLAAQQTVTSDYGKILILTHLH